MQSSFSAEYSRTNPVLEVFHLCQNTELKPSTPKTKLAFHRAHWTRENWNTISEIKGSTSWYTE